MMYIEQIKKSINSDEIILLTDSQFKIYLSDKIVKHYEKINEIVTIEEINKITKNIFNSYRGLGIIEDFLEDDNINEIMINGYDKIFIEKNGEMIKTDIQFSTEDELNRIIQKIVSDAGREVNISNPLVDVRLYDGSRANIIIPPLTEINPCVTIRKFSKKQITIKNLLEKKTINIDLYNFLEKLVISKYNILIGGGTSSGKTTFLNALTEFIPKEERIITIEDSRELKIIGNENLISLETRNANNSNKGKIDIKDLIKNSLRMRPDRIIVGEVRADETLDMLQAMNTGHEGSLTTAHANSSKDMISRLETMVLRAKEDIPISAVKKMIASSIDIIIFLGRINGKERKVLEVSELYTDESNEIKLNQLYKYDFKEDEFIQINKMLNYERIEKYNEKKK